MAQTISATRPHGAIRFATAATWTVVNIPSWTRVIAIHNEGATTLYAVWSSVNGDGGAQVAGDLTHAVTIPPYSSRSGIPVSAGRSVNAGRTSVQIASVSGTPTVCVEAEESER